MSSGEDVKPPTEAELAEMDRDQASEALAEVTSAAPNN